MSRDNPNLWDALVEPTDPKEWSWITRQLFTPADQKGRKDAPAQERREDGRR